jgi:hypothetical protein
MGDNDGRLRCRLEYTIEDERSGMRYAIVIEKAADGLEVPPPSSQVEYIDVAA